MLEDYLAEAEAEASSGVPKLVREDVHVSLDRISQRIGLSWDIVLDILDTASGYYGSDKRTELLTVVQAAINPTVLKTKTKTAADLSAALERKR